MKTKTKIKIKNQRTPRTQLIGLVAQTSRYPLKVTRRRMLTNGLVSGNMTIELLGGKNNSITTRATATEDAFVRNKGRIQ